jgi:leucyl-tRNA synthetase
MSRFLKRFWREVTTHAANPDHPMVRAATTRRSDSLPLPAGEGARRAEGEDAAGVVDPAALDAVQKTLRRQLHETIQKVGDDFGRRHAFNTAIASLMELLNALNKFNDQSDQGRAVRHEALEAMVLLLNPVVPHISHALWQVLGHAETLLEDQSWPQADTSAMERDTLTLAVQINGKLRATIDVAANASKDEAEALALAQPQVAHFLEGLSVRKVIVVPGKIVNIVAG